MGYSALVGDSSIQTAATEQGCSENHCLVETAAYTSAYGEIQPYSNEQIMSVVEVAPTPGKGNCMYVRHAYEPGELILVERPLFVIVPDNDRELWAKLNSLNEQHPLQLSPIWHQAAFLTIVTGTAEQIEIMKGKWVLDQNPPVTEDVYRILESTCIGQPNGEFVYSNGVVVDPKLYQFLLQVWPLNAFGHSSDPNGLVIYNKISYLAHSCDASACWHHHGEDLFTLRSRRKLKPGDELTISYLGEGDLLAPTHKRRELLRNWSFHCECSRCILTEDHARGFLCKVCHFGMVSFYYDRVTQTLNSIPCTMCEYKFTSQDVEEYLDLERAYVARVETIDPSDLADIQLVYNHARNVFKQHWCIYQLQTLLFECYKERGIFDQTRYYMQQRLVYVDQVMKRPLYCVAFMYEEFADMLVAHYGIDIEGTGECDVKIDIDLLNNILDIYFRSAALLAILTGYHHPYYYNVIAKRNKVEVALSRIIGKDA